MDGGLRLLLNPPELDELGNDFVAGQCRPIRLGHADGDVVMTAIGNGGTHFIGGEPKIVRGYQGVNP